MIWHWNLGFTMYYIQELVHEQNMEELYGVTTVLPCVISPKYKSTPNCSVPECASCQLACVIKNPWRPEIEAH